MAGTGGGDSSTFCSASESSQALFGGKHQAVDREIGGAHAADGVAKVFRRNGSGGGGIVELVGQTGGELAERHHFFALLFVARHVADAIRHDAHQTAGKRGKAFQHFGEMIGVQRGNSAVER